MSVSHLNVHDLDFDTQFAHAICTMGCAAVHVPDLMFTNPAYQEWKTFFDLPQSAKDAYESAVHSKNCEDFEVGYFGFGAEKASNYSQQGGQNLNEYFHAKLGCALSFPVQKRVGGSKFKYTQELMLQGNNIAKTLLHILVQQAPNDNFLSQSGLENRLNTNCYSPLRALHYPPFDNTSGEVTTLIKPHQDLGALTILYAPKGKGLQVEDAEGNWHDVVMPEGNGWLFVQAGKALHKASEGYYHAGTHSVHVPAGQKSDERYSLAHFFHFDVTAVLNANGETEETAMVKYFTKKGFPEQLALFNEIMRKNAAA